MKKKNIWLASLLMAVVAFNLHGMEWDSSDDEQPTARQQQITYYGNIKRFYSQELESLRFSPDRDSSIEKVSGATFKGLRRRFGVHTVIPVYWQHVRVAIERLTARIAALQEVAEQVKAFSQESERVLGSVKMGREFSLVGSRALKAFEELTTLRDDMENGGTLFAEKIRVHEHLNSNLLGKFNAAAASDTLGDEPPFFQLPS